MSYCSINPLPLVLASKTALRRKGCQPGVWGFLQRSQYIEYRPVFVAYHVQLPAVSCCTLPHSRGHRQSAIGSLTQCRECAAELLDSHDSLRNSTAVHPGLEGTPAPLHERFTTCHAHASTRHAFVSAPQLTTVHTRDFCACRGRQNAVVILRNFRVSASSMARTANYHGLSYHTIRPQDLPCGRRILDSSAADDLWVNAQQSACLWCCSRDSLCAGCTAPAFCQM